MKRAIASVAAALLLVGLSSLAQTPASGIPRLVRFAGTVTNGDGSPRAGTVGLMFALYPDQQGGAALWTELHNVQLDANGAYTVLLGANHADGIPAELFTADVARWLGVQVEAEAEQPRVMLVSVPYALNAANAETLGGFTAAELLAGGSVSRSAVQTQTSVSAQTAITLTRPTRDPVTAVSSAVLGPRVLLKLNSTPAGVLEAYDDAASTPLLLLLNPVGGNVGIGTTTPASPLTVAGMIQSTAGGFKFPDASTQATAGIPYVSGCTTGNVLGWNGSSWACAPVGVTSIVAGDGINASGTTAVTIAVDATKVPLLASANTFTANQAITGNLSVNGSVSGNGSGLTNLTADNLSIGTVPVGALSGTYGINISGNAATATAAASATAFTGALAGDVTGTQGATSVGSLRGRAIASTAPSDKQVLQFDAPSGQWQAAALSGGVLPYLNRNASDASSASIATTGGQLYSLTQSNTAAAAADRAVLKLSDSTTTPGLHDYLLIGQAANIFSVSTAGAVTATSFIGSGAALTGIPQFGVQNIFTGTPGGVGIDQGTLYVNPATTNSGDTLVGIAVGGTQKFKVDAGGNVSASGALTLPVNGLAVGTTQLVAANGRVGIGIATPSALLQVLAPQAANDTNAAPVLSVLGSGGGNAVSGTQGGTGSGIGMQAGGGGSGSGAGGAVSIAAGFGGFDNPNTTGGVGGALSLTSGAGGSGAKNGGNGGGTSLAGGDGGSTSGGFNGISQFGGAGAAVGIAGGHGGSANNNTGGSGGQIIVNGGMGATWDCQLPACGGGGSGGSIVLTAGSGGTPNGFAGSIHLDGGNVFVGQGLSVTGDITGGSVSTSTLNCTGCVNTTQMAVTYAGSSSKGGDATNALSLGGAVASSYPQLGTANTFTAAQNISAPSGTGLGVVSGDVTGIMGTGVGYGVRGRATVTAAVEGIASGASNYYNSGGYFESDSANGRGVYAVVPVTSGTNYGGLFETWSSNGTGVFASATAISGTTYGVSGVSSSPDGYGGAFTNASATGKSLAAFANNGTTEIFTVRSSGSVGIGTATPGTNAKLDVVGGAIAIGATAQTADAALHITSPFGSFGRLTQMSVTGTSLPALNLMASTDNSSAQHFWAWGVDNDNQFKLQSGYGFTPSGGLTVDASGNTHIAGSLTVAGTVSKPSGSFKIDHPLDPENKYLYHSFVESPDMMNIYNGNIVLDRKGEAWVVLPDWFEALNRDFRYQLTAVGAPGPNLYVAKKVENNRFKIAGGKPGSEVSWQVTGVRHDAYAEKHRIPVEEYKRPEERGTYLYPDAAGNRGSSGKN